MRSEVPSRGWCLYNEPDTCLLNGANLSLLGLWLIRLVRKFPLANLAVIQADLTMGHARNLEALLAGEQEEEHKES